MRARPHRHLPIFGGLLLAGLAWMAATLVAVGFIVGPGTSLACPIPDGFRVPDRVELSVVPFGPRCTFQDRDTVGAVIGTSTVAVDDPGTFFSSGAWIPVIIGIVLALLMSLAKSAVRPLANLATGGAAAPALSTAEDGASIVLVILAIVAPILVLIALGLMLFAFVALIRRVRRKRRERAAQATQLA